ncbi:hypothetical protein [Pseudoalteromonas mariniglutinosa]|uniref:hypothetical protein n=1 Tax=Pseudoalteromonas mariniglutinosa TaxID=206042 RepID=UPI00384ADEAE
MNKSVLSIALVLSLTACGDKPYEFEGKYLVTEGEECAPDTKSKDKDMVFFEIIAQGKGDSKTYTAKIPMGAAWGLPTSSNGNSSPTEKEELNFSFNKEGKSGLFTGKPSIDMTVTVIPHEMKENHIWLTKWDATVAQNGMVKQLSPLEEMKKQAERPGEKIKFSDKGLCLSKKYR